MARARKLIMSEEIEYETRVLKYAILPKGKPIFDERCTEVSIADEAAGEYVQIEQCTDAAGRQVISIDSLDEWQQISKVVEKLLKND